MSKASAVMISIITANVNKDLYVFSSRYWNFVEIRYKSYMIREKTQIIYNNVVTHKISVLHS